MSKQDPSHYKLPGKVQLIDVTKHCSFPVGSAIKYLFRAGNKAGETALDDLLKAKWFVDLLIQEAIDAKAKEIVEADKQADSCNAAGRPLKPCGDCAASGSCIVEKVAEKAPQELDGDDIAEYHTSVPEAITRAGVRRKIL